MPDPSISLFIRRASIAGALALMCAAALAGPPDPGPELSTSAPVTPAAEPVREAPVTRERRVQIEPVKPPLHAPRGAAKKEAGEPPRAAVAAGTPAASSGEPPVAAVSMSDLRSLIDQKIAEVRSRQEPAPVVKVSQPSSRRSKTSGVSREAAPGGIHAGHGDVHWSYAGEGGPERWADLRAENQLCRTGKRQSPIDIRDGIAVQLEPIAFDYRPTAFRVVDNGHTVQVNLDPGNAITVHGRRYDLVQFHFHRPSEERINGRQFEMVAHLVHKDPEGRLAIVAVLMDQGRAHPMVQLVWNSLPLEKNTDLKSPVPIDLSLMLPEQRQYFAYMGSLTTPPCTEGVLWLVMKQPASMSREQIAIFSRLYPMNARPLQSAAGRLIKEDQ